MRECFRGPGSMGSKAVTLSESLCGLEEGRERERYGCKNCSQGEE